VTTVLEVTEHGGMVIFRFIQWDQLGELEPAVVTKEFAAKRQEKKS